MSKGPKRQKVSGGANRTRDIDAANPNTALQGCLAKTPYPTEEEALQHDRKGGTPYRCTWCGAWHLTLRGYKGQKKGL
jgi:hypothetical protein